MRRFSTTSQIYHCILRSLKGERWKTCEFRPLKVGLGHFTKLGNLFYCLPACYGGEHRLKLLFPLKEEKPIKSSHQSGWICDYHIHVIDHLDKNEGSRPVIWFVSVLGNYLVMTPPVSPVGL